MVFPGTRHKGAGGVVQNGAHVDLHILSNKDNMPHDLYAKNSANPISFTP